MPLANDPVVAAPGTRALSVLFERSRFVDAELSSNLLPNFHFRLCRVSDAEGAVGRGEVENADSRRVGAIELDSSNEEEGLAVFDIGTVLLSPGEGGCLLARLSGPVKIECGLVIDKSLLEFVAVASGRSGQRFQHEFDCAMAHLL